MDNRLTKLYHFLYKAAVLITTVIMAVIFLMSFVIQSRVEMNGGECVSFHRNNPLVYVCLPAFVLLLWGFRKKIQEINSGKLYRFCAAIYMIFGFFFILALSTDLKGDAYWVRGAMESFAEGDFRQLQKGNYISRYPHQLGMVTFERILAVFSKNTKICFVANLFLVLLNNWVTWKIACLIFPERPLTHNITIILSFLFIPQFFFIAFVYGTIPSFTMLLLASYFQIKYLKEKRRRNFMLMIVFATLSCILRSNNLIGIIAFMIIFGLESIKEKNFRWLAAAAALMIFVSAGIKVLNVCYEKESGQRIAYAEPKLLWVAMGLRDESSRLGGWFDGFNVGTYESVNYDAEAANKLAKKSIADSMKKFADSPRYAAAFFGKKAASTWCDPLFQSLWSGPLSASNQGYDDDRLSVLYTDGTCAHIITRQLCQVLLIFMYATALLFLLQTLRSKKYDIYLFAIICFVGGVLFHLVWETKSQYVYSYVFAMIPYMSNAVDSTFSKIKRKDKVAAKCVPEDK